MNITGLFDRKTFAAMFAWLCLALPVVAEAQNISASDIMRAQRRGDTTSPYGNLGEQYDEFGNLIDPSQQPEEGEGADTTKKERKIRKPLESYFFNDSIRALPNFRWSISRDYNDVRIMPMDTTLTDWRIDYPYQLDGIGDMTLGGLGQSTQAFNYFDRTQGPGFAFAQTYSAYTYDLENVPFYNSKRPLIRMMYLESGQKRYREENFDIMCAQNISPSTGFNIDYRSRSTKGVYEWSRTKDHNLTVAASHTGKRYSVFAGYINNHIEQRENGGVVGKWAITDTVFEMQSGVPMKLTNSEAQNIYRNNAFYVKQSYAIPFQRVTEYDFSLAHLSALYIGHTFEYNAWSKTYTDKYATYTDDRGSRDDKGNFIPTTHEYYKNWYINPDRTRDSLYERVISNRIYVQFQPWNRNGVVGTVDGGVALDLYTFSQFSMGSYLSGKYDRRRETAWYVYGAANGKIKKYADWGVDIKFYPSGYRGGDLSLGANIALRAYLRGHPLILSGRFRQELRSPSYWQENLFSNHYVWSAPLNKENETRFEVKFEVPDFGLELGAWQGFVTDKIYYDAESRVAQHHGTVSVTSLYARKDFTFAGVHLNHRVLVQWSSNQEVIPVPLVGTYLSYYYEFWIKRDVLRMQIGMDGRFNTSYYAPGYNPALSAFYNQRETKYGNYPYLDAFIMAKWKRMRIYLKYSHWNWDVFGNKEFFTVAGYPLNPSRFKMGISWGFYD